MAACKRDTARRGAVPGDMHLLEQDAAPGGLS